MIESESSDRLSELAEFCRRKYDSAGLEQHNWSHIVRNIYRAEKIAETEEYPDMEVLYAALLLHDIGATVGDYSDHEENSRKVAREKLPEFGFSEEETERVVEVLREFAGEKEVESMEAKILSDADKLEKSSIAAIFNTYKVAEELDKDIEEMVKDLSKYRRLADEGFYTDKAKEIDDGGLDERLELMQKLKTRLEEREDFSATEKDLRIGTS